jgi:integrase
MTGMRKSEILFLKVKDYREINDYRVLEFKGKGGKVGQKVLHPICVEALEEYREWMNQQGREHGPEDWLFQPTRNPKDPSNLNKPLNPRTINEIVSHYGKKIGLNFNISPHSARATFIGELLEAGVDIYSVAREVNHSSVKTTQETILTLTLTLTMTNLNGAETTITMGETGGMIGVTTMAHRPALKDSSSVKLCFQEIGYF